ncbi:MAG TPA: protein kinase [Candidatus Sulfotelmatobacter sp.]
MGLSAGTRLGPYEILAPLGAGGMGEVYRARDTKLRRDVAIKILPEIFTSNPERLARFEREARMLAALNHSHIAAIYGVEDAGGVRALVLELVEGETLRERLRPSSLPLAEALVIARQIAEALEAAHERGIIHRDLKPSNIKITPEGTVKVLDFGLAKTTVNDAEGPDSEEMPTRTANTTSAGVILGTAAYMSPEQARGKAVDKRTDIWALGCVLFEMISGRVTFSGETASDTIAAILEREPPWNRLPESTPLAVRHLLRRCLEKDPRRRLRDIGDARIALEDAIANPVQDELARGKPVWITRRAAITALGSAGVGAVVGGLVGSRWRRVIQPRSLTRFRIPLPEGAFALASFNRRVAISPDGTHIAFNIISGGVSSYQGVGNDVFYLHSVHELEPKVIPFDAGAPFFSADSRWVGYMGSAAGKPVLRKMALEGGPPTDVCATGYVGATWTADDMIYFVSEIPGGLLRVAASGGDPKEVAKIDLAKGERLHRYPCALPGGKEILLTVGTADTETFDDARIAVLNIETGQSKTLVEGGTHPRYSPSGHLLYARDAMVFAVRFDANRLEVTGQAFPVLEGVLMSRNSGVANYDVSASGDLAYIPGVCDKGERTLVWVDRNGNAEPLKLAPKAYLHPRISPDMRRLAVEIEGPNHNFYVYDFAREVLSHMTTDGKSHWPVWSPDGTQLVYRSGPMGRFKMWQVPADKSAPAIQLSGTGISQSAESWSPDGHAIAYTAVTPEAGAHIMVESLEGEHESRPFVDIKAPAGSPKFSPDGRWLAYCSNETKKPQVYVQAFPGPGPKIQVSSDGGTDPVWKMAGGELYFRNGDKMMAVQVSTAPTFTAGHPRVLWEGHYSHGMSTSCGPPGATSSNYDVTADGQRFLMIKDEAPDTALSKTVVVVLGWSDELNRLSKV